MPEAEGFLKVVLSIRTDMFPQLSLHNQANKVRDNGVLLDWRTTYENYRNSALFNLCNSLLSYNNEGLPKDEYWDYYFPWFTDSTIWQKRVHDDSFIDCLRLSLFQTKRLHIYYEGHSGQMEKTAAQSDLASLITMILKTRFPITILMKLVIGVYTNFLQKGLVPFYFSSSFLNGKSKFTYSEYTDLRRIHTSGFRKKYGAF
jgi:hypothetical protein